MARGELRHKKMKGRKQNGIKKKERNGRDDKRKRLREEEVDGRKKRIERKK